MQNENRITTNRENCTYTSCYCEENVWKLCEFVRTERTTHLEQVFAVFISNKNRTVPLWKQKSGRGDHPVIWDYHVILLHISPQSDTMVYDLDSVLSFPCSLQLYGTKALRSDYGIKPAFHRKFRVIPADVFLQNFASDRSHMRKADGSWQMPPPSYPPIHTAESQMNLDDFISMESSVGWGSVYSLNEFLQCFLQKASSETSSAAATSLSS